MITSRTGIVNVVFFLMIRRPPRSTLDRSSAASDVYKRQVNNTCISFLRKKKLDIHSLDNEKVFEVADSQDSGMRANLIEQKSRISMVNEAIGLLNPADAEIITLFYKAEQSLEETAQVLGIEVNAAKVRLFRARTRLKEKMETYFIEEVRNLN